MKTMTVGPHESEILKATLSGTVTAGDFFDLATAGVGIYADSGVSGDDVAFYIGGQYRITAETGVAWTAGDILYLAADNTTFTKTVGTNQIAGRAVRDKASASAVGYVKLIPQVA